MSTDLEELAADMFGNLTAAGTASSVNLHNTGSAAGVDVSNDPFQEADATRNASPGGDTSAVSTPATASVTAVSPFSNVSNTPFQQADATRNASPSSVNTDTPAQVVSSLGNAATASTSHVTNVAQLAGVGGLLGTNASTGGQITEGENLVQPPGTPFAL